MASKKKSTSQRSIAENRRAKYDYEIIETIEAGIMLEGSEVKSLRTGKANIADSYASDENGALYLINGYIPEYTQAGRDNHETRRPRKLLLHANEIKRLTMNIARDGLTLVPLRLYFNDRGIAKLQLALGKGKKRHDKRETKKERDWNRQKQRLLRERG